MRHGVADVPVACRLGFECVMLVDDIKDCVLREQVNWRPAKRQEEHGYAGASMSFPSIHKFVYILRSKRLKYTLPPFTIL